jgi:hypothetical protein
MTFNLNYKKVCFKKINIQKNICDFQRIMKTMKENFQILKIILL